MDQNDENHLSIFKAALAALTEKAGGSLVIPISNSDVDNGTIFYHVVPLGYGQFLMHVSLIKADAKKH